MIVHSLSSSPYSYVPENLNQSIQQKIASWRLCNQQQIQRINYSDRCEMAYMQIEAGESELAYARIKDLEPVAQRRWSKFRKQTVEFSVVFLGSLSFSTLPQLLAVAINRDSLSLGIGLLGGGAAAWLTHNRATVALGRLRRRHDALQALKSLSQQHQSYPVQNELVDSFFKAQEIRLLQTESFKLPFQVDMVLAIGMSLLEIAAAYILTQPAGVWLATLASIFPVAVIWLAAIFQSDAVEFADASAELIRAYEGWLQRDEVSEMQALHVEQLDAIFKYFTLARPNSIRTVQGAVAKATSEFAQRRTDQLEVEGIQTIKSRKLEYRQAIAELSLQYPRQQISDEVGYRKFDHLPQQQQLEQKQAVEINAATAELNAELEDDLKMLQTEYNQQIQRWQRIKIQADNEFDQVELG